MGSFIARHKRAILALLGIVSLIGAGMLAFAQDDDDFNGEVNAPPFPTDTEWLNVPAPLTWEDLRGKVVLLDFWTYGCINCIHIIPDLKRLEEEFADELVVIGVHSAKFDQEGDTENLRQIVQRYEIEHPVVNDNKFQVWNSYAVRAWPTLVLVDPNGKIYGQRSGEGVYDTFQPYIEDMIAFFDEKGQIDRTPIEITPETEKRAESLLAFPGKVLADPANDRLFITDSNHHRIVIADLETFEVIDVIGGMEKGRADGTYEVARFNQPQGLTLSDDGGTLYVADTENHLIRAVDLDAKAVSTIAGTGEQRYVTSVGPNPLEQDLNSPWDLVRVDNTLYIAMAGPHQLWSLNLATGTIAVHSGSGRENIIDGSHASAQLAQPSGITTDGEVLYFADSEASGIRVSDVDPSGGVRTLVGTGLFVFGDEDGIGDDARLQHPLGVTYYDGLVYVADTYNDKIKTVDPETRAVETMIGDADGGYRDGTFDDALFDEPGGIHYADSKLYIADTNNHAVRIADLEARTVTTIQFPNPEALMAGREAALAAAPFTGEEADYDEIASAPGEGVISLHVTLPEGYKLNEDIPFTATWYPDGEVVQIADENREQRLFAPGMPLEIPAAFAEGSAELAADLNIVYCEEVNESICLIDRVRVHVPVTVGTDNDEAGITFTRDVTLPEGLFED
jgi:thiol-disulfide isomerase/thioredoxin